MTYAFRQVNTKEHVMRLERGFILFSPPGCLLPDTSEAATYLVFPEVTFRLEGDLRAEFAHIANTSYGTGLGAADEEELLKMYDRYPERRRAYKRATPGVDFVQLSLMMHLNDDGDNFLEEK